MGFIHTTTRIISRKLIPLTKSETQSITSTNIDRLMINHRDARASGDDSDWALAELIVINAVLNLTEIECVEGYLIRKYNLYRPIHPPPITNDTKIIQSCLHRAHSDKIEGIYNGHSFDLDNNIEPI